MTIVNYLQKLIDAGIPVISATDDGAASFSRTLTPAEEDKLNSIIDAGYAVRIARARAAEENAALAAEFKMLTPQQAVDYIDTNVTSLATAKVVLKIMARILIAMRDQIWPGLPEK